LTAEAIAPPRRRARPWRRACVCLAFLALLIAVRAPFLRDEAVGEEGLFAFLVASPTPTSQMSPDGLPKALIANLDGISALNSFRHSIGPYEVLERIPGAFLRALDVVSQPPTTRIVIVRLAFLALFMIGVSGLAWTAARAVEAPGRLDAALALLIPFYALTTPLAVGGSIQMQLDGAFGVLVAGLAATLLLSAPTNERGRLQCAIAGAIVGFGRAEWLLALGVVAVATLLATALLKTPRAGRKLVLDFLIGVALGAAAQFAISPVDFALSGATAQSDFQHVSPWRLAERDARYTIPVALLLASLAVVMIPNLRRRLGETPLTALVAGGAGAIFAGFALSGWAGDGFPRYYAPALAMATYVATRLAIDESPAWGPAVKAVLTLALIGGLAWNGDYLYRAHRDQVSITCHPGVSLAATTQRYAEAAQRDDGVLTFQQAGIWLTHPTTRFMGEDMGYPGALRYLRERYPDWVDRLASP